MDGIKEYIKENKDRFIEELFELLRLPSISADPAYSQDVVDTARLVADKLRESGANAVEVCETPGYPIVYGEKIISKSLPTVLVYGHYDVQPPDPVELWSSGPFDPVIRKTELHPDGAIFARGSCDDKGQFFMHIKAFEFMMNTGKLPCNIKFMIEGEEEVGSESLEWFIRNNKERLKNDLILISDTGILSNENPSITTGLRGLSYMEVEVQGPNRDLHSGLYGGAVANPINVLCKLIASLHDSEGKVVVQGFYDKVKELSAAERREMAKAPFSQNEFNKALGIEAADGEKPYSTPERISIRPTLDVNGIWGGYTGEGTKTVIPAKASAKISMRLVPEQDWKEIAQLFESHFKSITPNTVKVKVKTHHGGQAYVMPLDHPGYDAAAKAYKTTFGKDPIPQRTGGSIPIVSLFEKELGSKSILMGFGLDSDAIHSPNEHYGLFNFFKGIETIPWFFHYYMNTK